MACRVGMTTDPETRLASWRSEYPTLRNWRILHRVNSKTEAQRLENLEAQRLGCVAHPGGEGPEVAVWHVYYFEY